MIKINNVQAEKILNIPSCEVCISKIYDGMFNVKGIVNDKSTDTTVYALNENEVDRLLDECMTIGSIAFDKFCSSLGITVEANI